MILPPLHLFPGTLLIFVAIVNRTGFFMSFSDTLLMVYREITNICMLMLYFVTLLNLFISYKGFSVGSLGFSIYKIM